MADRRPDPSEAPRWLQVSAGWSWRLLLVAAALTVIVLAIVALRPIVLPLFFAVLLSAYLRPVVTWLLGRGIPRGVAAGIGLLILLAALGGLAALATYAITDQADVIADRLESGVNELEDTAAERFGEDAVADARQRIEDGAASLQETGVRGAVRFASAAVEVVTGAFVMLFALFYVLRDADVLWARFTKLLSPDNRAFTDRAGRHAWAQLQGYMYGTATIAAVDAVLIGLGALVLGVPSALAIGLLTFFASFVPFIGAFAAGLFAVLLALADGGVGQALAMLAVVVVVQQIEGNLLQPIIQSRFVALHPLTIILAVTAGGALGGLVGLLIAVPVVAVVMAALVDLREGAFFARGELSPRVDEGAATP